MKVNQKTVIKVGLFILVPTVLLIVFWVIYRNYLFDNTFINKVILKKDMEYKYFTFDELDSPKGNGDIGETYFKKGKYYLTNSGKEHFSPYTLKMLDDARDIIEREWNVFNPTKKIYFIINSGYRTDIRNAEVGGVENSAHRDKNGTKAKAVDIAWGNYNNEQREKIVDSLRRVGFVRFGFANSFVHVDNDETLPQTTWVYSGYNGIKY